MRRSNLIGAIVVGLVAFVVLAGTGNDIGLTYDEPIYISKGMQAYSWLTGLIHGVDATSDRAIRQSWDATKDQQPGTIKLIFGVTTGTLGTALGLAPLAASRLGTNLLSAILLGTLFWFVASHWGRMAGIVAAVGLMFMPRVWAHMHLAALDAPIMALSFCTVALVYAAARRNCPWLAIAAGAVFGLALGTKLNSFFIPFIVLPWLLFVGKRRIAAWTAGSLAIVGPIVFWATWPWLWHDTWHRFAEYFAFHLHHYHVATTYFGVDYELAPWHLAPVLTAITTPPVLLALAVVGAGVLVALWRRHADVETPSEDIWRKNALMLAVWALAVNIGPSMLPQAPKYGGVRLFLAVFPYIAILAGVGYWWVSRWILEKMPKSASEVVPHFASKMRVLVALPILLAVLLATGNSHPYGMSYYNSLIGGPGGAYAAGMEPSYWGDTYLAAVKWLNEKAQPDATVWINVVGFATTVEMYKPFGMMREDLNVSAGDAALSAADYIVVQNKQNEMTAQMKQLAAKCTPIFTEMLDGAPLVWIFAGDDPAVREIAE